LRIPFKIQEHKNLRIGLPSKLTMERLQLLDALGFVWNAPRGAKRKRSTIQNGDKAIQDRKKKGKNAENEMSDSFEGPQSIESGLTGHSENKSMVDNHIGKNFKSPNPLHSSQCPDLNYLNPGMSR
jgi:hypothetical protein